MGFRPRVPYSTVISRLGLSGGLKLCLDAGDVASYASGQSWLDTSGNGYDFFLGANGSAAADDPTFNGTPGALTPSEFWSFDGGDLFRYDTTNETWMNNIHKAGAKCTILAWYYPITGVNNIIAGTLGGTSGSGNIGFWFGNGSDNFASFRVGNGSIGGASDLISSLVVSNATWQFIAASIQSGVASGSTIQLNGSSQTFTYTYTSPSAGNAIYSMEVGARGNGNSPFPNGSRLAMLAVWEGVALSQAQINAIYAATHSVPVFHKTTRFFTRKY